MVARYVIPEINGYVTKLRESQKFLIENRAVFDRAGQAIMAKIMENKDAAEALKVTDSPRFAAAKASVPKLLGKARSGKSRQLRWARATPVARHVRFRTHGPSGALMGMTSEPNSESSRSEELMTRHWSGAPPALSRAHPDGGVVEGGTALGGTGSAPISVLMPAPSR